MSSLEKPLWRDRQLETLELLLCQPTAKLPPFVFTYGLSGTGKTHTVRWLLESKQINHVVFHCVELYNTRLLFETVIDKLTGVHTKCENICDFISTIKRQLDPEEAYVILFEESERFRDADHYLRQVFSRLSDLTDLNISCIWESKLDWSKFVPSRGLPAPLILHFPQYTKSEVQDLLVESLPGDRSRSFKESYISMLLPIFYFTTRSLTELQHISQVNYQDYCSPLDRGECGEEDTRTLWFNIDKQLKQCISSVNLREVESQQLRELMEKSEDSEKVSSVSVPSHRNSLELPYYSKFLLISSYLASYNPQRTDKRFFVKQHGKQKKSALSIRAKDAYSSQLTGPKPFPLERLLAIFYNIVDGGVNPTANIYSQITSLARLQLITTVGADSLEQPKYRCNVDLDFVKRVARMCNFDVQKYLYCQ